VWAREHGCPWDAWTCAAAARKGTWNVLQWAREHNCPCGEHICDYAAEGGHLQMLQWGRGRTAVRAPTLKYCSDVPP